ncbi:DUF1127 domain-containing protein [Pelagibacterium halotolerans]|uniref:DUF1127 domain-containing protein n=1 Tax=Pelagibacterium halotolerans TaxID=531813 RepID=UPI00384AA2EF
MTMIERNRYIERSPFFWIGKAVLTATMTNAQPHAEQHPSRLGKTAAKIVDLAQAWKRKRRHRKALLDLKDMEDWQLKDIGVTRSAVEDALFTRK